MILRSASIFAAAAFISVAALQVNATPSVVFNDAINDIAPGLSTGGGTLDLVSMEVSNTNTDITFSLTVNGSVNSVDWGKFMIGIANLHSAGTTTSDGWARPIFMAGGSQANAGMTNWIGSWVDNGGGAENRSYSAGNWNLTGATYNSNFGTFTKGGSNVSFTVSIASLGMTLGDSFLFDAYSSGGGNSDGAIDALANPNYSVTNWGDSYTSSTSTGIFAYTINSVPTPGAIALVGLAGLIARRRKA